MTEHKVGHIASGLVVDDINSGVRFAVSAANYDPETQNIVRELKPWETVQGFRPRRKESDAKANHPSSAQVGKEVASVEDTKNHKKKG